MRVTNTQTAADILRDRLVQELSNGLNVLWLVTGGSNISLGAEVMRQIPEDLTPKLTMLLTDERFGEVGHKDSNVRQLDEAGFDPKRGRFIPVIEPGVAYEDTIIRYGNNFQQALAASDIAIALFGMGADGHIAGILPGSPAVDSADYAAGYDTADFRRVTLTPKALLQLTAAYLVVFGEQKLQPLENLQTQDLPLDQQPAQLLKQIPDAYVLNDQIGE